jgi:hypothetical protein
VVPAILFAVAALLLQPQPGMSQSSTLGNVANDIFGALFGAGAGEGLGCLVQGCSPSSNPDWSMVNTQLSTITKQLSMLSNDIQTDNCNTSAGVYATYMSGTNADTLNSIALLTADLAKIAADRQGDMASLQSDLNQLKSDEKKITNFSTIHANMNSIIRGTGGSPGGIQLYSQQLSACHTYFNSNDFNLVQEQWALFALAQANACMLKINYDNSHSGDPANDISACKAYQMDINAAQVPQMANPTSPQPLQANAFIDVKSGIGWRDLGSVNSSCQKLWDNGGGNAFIVCSTPGTGRTGAPWQTLPYYKDIQTLLNDSGCPSSSKSACLATQGWPSGGTNFWADSAYSNVVDPSPKGPWGGSSFCEAYGCHCANGDCYDWYNVVYQDTSGNNVTSFPPCWTSVVGDPVPAGLIAWECGVVDAAAAGFNSVGQSMGANNLQEWVGNGAPNRAPGAPFPGGYYYWAGTPPFGPPYGAGAGQAMAKPGTVETPTATATPAETATPGRGR